MLKNWGVLPCNFIAQSGCGLRQGLYRYKDCTKHIFWPLKVLWGWSNGFRPWKSWISNLIQTEGAAAAFISRIEEAKGLDGGGVWSLYPYTWLFISRECSVDFCHLINDALLITAFQVASPLLWCPSLLGYLRWLHKIMHNTTKNTISSSWIILYVRANFIHISYIAQLLQSPGMRGLTQPHSTVAGSIIPSPCFPGIRPANDLLS